MLRFPGYSEAAEKLFPRKQWDLNSFPEYQYNRPIRRMAVIQWYFETFYSIGRIEYQSRRDETDESCPFGATLILKNTKTGFYYEQASDNDCCPTETLLELARLVTWKFKLDEYAGYATDKHLTKWTKVVTRFNRYDHEHFQTVRVFISPRFQFNRPVVYSVEPANEGNAPS